MGRYENTGTSRIKKATSTDDVRVGVLKYDTTMYPKAIESNDDIFVITQEGDRLDNLAMTFYGDPNLWWYIAQTNHLDSMTIKSGIRLRIPTSL